MKTKKVLVIGDLHCGSMCGLTPPEWIVSSGRDPFYNALQEEMWINYENIINSFGEIDTLVVNGDVIDGKGVRSGGTELITSDLFEQSEMAISAISKIKAKNIFFTYGTPYHTTSSSGEDMDAYVAHEFDAPIEDELTLDVDGVIFSVKHKTGSSTSPYGRTMPVGKAHLWDWLKAIDDDDVPANIYLRSHVHYWSFCGGKNWTACTLPALQASNTKFGARQCIGSTDWGMCAFNISDGKLSGWDLKLVSLETNKKNIFKA